MDDELELRPTPPDPSHAEQSLALLRHTVLRFQHDVRADRDRGEEMKPKRIWEACLALVAALPYDWRVGRLATYAPGGTRQSACDRVYSAIVGIGFFGGLFSVVLAKSRWGTCNQALGKCVAGCSCHLIVPRVWIFTFPKAWVQAPLVGEDADDYHRITQGKIFRVVRRTNDVNKRQLWVRVTVCAAPIDHVLQE